MALTRWKKLPEKIVQGDEDGPAARNLRKGGICFRGEPANICTSRREFFLDKVIPLWNELPKEVRGAPILNNNNTTNITTKGFPLYKESLLYYYYFYYYYYEGIIE